MPLMPRPASKRALCTYKHMLTDAHIYMHIYLHTHVCVCVSTHMQLQLPSAQAIDDKNSPHLPTKLLLIKNQRQEIKVKEV